MKIRAIDVLSMIMIVIGAAVALRILTTPMTGLEWENGLISTIGLTLCAVWMTTRR